MADQQDVNDKKILVENESGSISSLTIDLDMSVDEMMDFVEERTGMTVNRQQIVITALEYPEKPVGHIVGVCVISVLYNFILAVTSFVFADRYAKEAVTILDRFSVGLTLQTTGVFSAACMTVGFFTAAFVDDDLAGLWGGFHATSFMLHALAYASFWSAFQATGSRMAGDLTGGFWFLTVASLAIVGYAIVLKKAYTKHKSDLKFYNKAAAALQ